MATLFGAVPFSAVKPLYMLVIVDVKSEMLGSYWMMQTTSEATQPAVSTVPVLPKRNLKLLAVALASASP